MKHFVLLWLLLGVCYNSYSQTITVTDKQTGEALELVNIYTTYPATMVTTAENGEADISSFEGAEKITISMMGYATQVVSYDQLSQKGFKIALGQSGVSLDGVVISATKWNQSVRDVPARVTSISTRDIALLNPQTAADMLSISGEVFMQKSQQGGGSPMIRGFSTNRLLYAVDGVRMNTAIFRAGNLQNVISLDPFATENTEVIFGPGSVIYGSDAIGGVMSFTTLTPQFSTNNEPLIKGKAVTRYSSANNEKTGHFDVNVGWKKIASVTSFSYFNYGDLKMGSKGPHEYKRPFYVQRIDSTDVVVTNDDPLVQRSTGYTQTNMMQKLRFAPNKRWDIQYGFHYSQTSDYSRYDRHIRYKNGLPRSAEWYYGPQIWMMNNLGVTHTAVSGIYDQLSVKAAHQLFEESRVDRDMNDPELRSRKEKVNAYSLNIDLNKGLGKNTTLYYGAEVVRNDVQSTGTDKDISTGDVQSGLARYPQADWSSYAAYATLQQRIADKLTIQAGARYNQYVMNTLFDTTFYPFPYTTTNSSNGALTGSLGAVYHPTEKWSVSANLSTGFRAPNVDDAGKVFDSEPGSVIIPNPDLGPEYAYNADLGIAKVFGKYVKIDVTVYYTILQNAMVRRDFTLSGEDSIMYDGTLSRVMAIQNSAVATVHGLQAGFEIKLPKGFGLSSRINLQRGEEELDNGTKSPLRHAAPTFGVSHLTYTAKKLMLDVYVIYNGERAYNWMPQEEIDKPYLYAVDANGLPYSPGWYTLNLKAMYQLTAKLSLSAGLENITDQRYRTYSSGIAGAGRNFVMSLRADL